MKMWIRQRSRGHVDKFFSAHFYASFCAQALVRKSFRERRKLLHDTVLEKEGEFVFATSQDTTDTEEIQSLLDLSVKGRQERVRACLFVC